MQRPDSNPKSAFGVTKPPLHLVPGAALVRTAMVMKLGAEKYGPYNWRDESVAASVYVSAAERHLRAWFDGEHTDPESGQSHLAHVAACMMILIDAEETGRLVDDRPVQAPTGDLIRDLTYADGPPRRVSTEDFLRQYERVAADRPAPVIETPPQASLCRSCQEPIGHAFGCPETR